MSGIQQLLLSGSQAAAPAVDSYFYLVTLLLPGNGTNGAQNNTFLDGSTNNFSITRNGNTTQGTFAPFGSNWSNYFDGTNDRLTIADNAALRPGTGNFTIEAWVFRVASGATHTIYAKGGASTGFVFEIASTNVLRFTNTTSNIDSTGTIAANTWTHVAVVREGTGSNQLKLYINGVNDGQGTVSTNFNQTEELRIGEDRGATGDFNGYISNVRFVTSAVYTGNFTPPTAPLTAITNTSLLTCQSNRFIDNSTNAFTITVNGNTSVQRFSPFSPTAPYAAGTDGGSGYFDGTGDYLSLSNNAAFAFGTGAWTIECWVYASAIDALSVFFSCGTNGTQLGTNSSNYIAIAQTNVAFELNSSTVLPLNQWNHVVGVRDGSNNTSIFLNGTRIATATLSTNYSSSGTAYINYNPFNAGSDFTGYGASLRVVKGTAVYDPAQTTLTVPTSPLTAVSGTSLLLNFTNAGIIDNAMMNDLETVGNAQISTAQSKFGGGSIGLGSNDAYLLTNPTTSLEFGSGDFTIEFWWYPTSTSRQALYHGSFGADWSIGIDYSSVSTNQKIGIWASSNGSSWNLINADGGGNGIGTITITQNAWNHIAYVRSGTTWMLFVNGVRDLNLTGISGSVVNRATYSKGIGVWWSTTAMAEASGYIDDLRITKGYARYTANFTAPTTPFPLS